MFIEFDVFREQLGYISAFVSTQSFVPQYSRDISYTKCGTRDKYKSRCAIVFRFLC